MGNTHKINVGIGNWLALRAEPSEESVTDTSQVSNVRHFWQSDTFPSHIHGTEFEILEEGLGYNCQWDYVKISDTDITGYFYNKYTIALDTTKTLEYDCAGNVLQIGFPHAEDWTTKAIGEPYLERTTSKWCVSIESVFDPVQNLSIEERMELSIRPGLKNILISKGKRNDDETLNNLLDVNVAPKVIKAEDNYFPPNNIQSMRVLVTFPNRYLVKLHDLAPEEEYEEAWNKITLSTVNYKGHIKSTVSTMMKYAREIDMFDGTIENLDLRKEARRLEKVATELESILSVNGVETSDNVQIEIGLNTDGGSDYIAEFSDGVHKKLTKGTHSVLHREPFDSSRTMNYLAKVHLMALVDADTTTWSDFANRYTDFTKIRIKPSQPKGTSPADISQNSYSLNNDPLAPNSVAANNINRKLQGIYKSLGFKQDPCNQGIGFDYWNEETRKKHKAALVKAAEAVRKRQEAKKMREVFPSYKSKEEMEAEKAQEKAKKDAADKRKEQWNKDKENAKKEIAKEASKQWDNVQDAVLGDLRPLLDAWKESDEDGGEQLDKVYKDLLHKICIWDLAIPAMACFKPPEGGEGKTFTEGVDEFKEMMNNFPVAMCKQPGSLGKACVPTLSLPSMLPTEDLFEKMSKIVWDAIINLLKGILIELVKKIIEAFLSMCDEEEGDEAAKEANQNILDLLNLANLPDGVDLGSLLDDVRDLLNPSELCKLLNGAASKATIATVYNLIQANHPALIEKFKTKSFIVDFFSTLGAAMDSKMCEDLAELPEDTFLPCRDPYATSSAMENSLNNRTAELNKEQIQDQLDKARKRKVEKVEMLSSIMDMMNSSKKGENPFQNLVPSNIFGSAADGLLDISSDVANAMQDIVLNNLLEGAYSSFNHEAKLYTNLYTKRESESSDISFKVEINNNMRVNSEVMRMVGQGIPLDDFEAYAENNGGVVPYNYVVKKTNSRIKSLLGEMETSGVFHQGLDSEGFYYELTLPQDPEILAALAILQNTYPDLYKAYSELTTITDWRVRYKMPFVSSEIETVEDNYILEIFPTDDPLSSQTLRKVSETPVDSNVREYIDINLKITEPEHNIEINIENYTGSLLMAGSTVEDEICHEGEFLHKYNLPQQSVALGRYVENIWHSSLDVIFKLYYDNMDLPPDSDLANSIKNLDDRIKNYFAKNVHAQGARDIIALVGHRISESQLLRDNIERISVKGNEQKKYTPEIMRLSLRRVQTNVQKACGIDPHLLKINHYKTKLQDHLSQNNFLSEDLLNMNTDGTARDELNNWESSVVDTMVKILVRVFMLDYAVRGIFPLSQFRLEADDFVVEYLMKQMVGELENNYGTEFTNRFLSYCGVVFTDMLGTGEIKPDAITATRMEGLKSIIVKELNEVYGDLSCIIHKDLGLNLNALTEQTYQKLLVEEWLPIIDLPFESHDPRFSVLGDSLETVKESLHKYIIEYPALVDALAAATGAYNTFYENMYLPIQALHSVRSARVNELWRHYEEYVYSGKDINWKQGFTDSNREYQTDDEIGGGSVSAFPSGYGDTALYWQKIRIEHQANTTCPQYRKSVRNRYRDAEDAGFTDFSYTGSQYEGGTTNPAYYDAAYDMYKTDYDIDKDCKEGNWNDWVVWAFGWKGGETYKEWQQIGGEQYLAHELANWPIDELQERKNFWRGVYNQGREDTLFGLPCDDHPWCKDRKEAYIKYFVESANPLNVYYPMGEEESVKKDFNEKETQLTFLNAKVKEKQRALDSFALPPNASWSDLVEITQDETTSRVIKAEQKFGLLTKVSVDGNSFDLTNGNFFLEKFWKIKRRSDSAIRANLKSNFHTDTNINTIMDAFSAAWDDADLVGFFEADASHHRDEYLNVAKFEKEFKKFLIAFKAGVGSIPGILNINPSNWDEAMAKGSAWRLNIFFHHLHPGLRLMYLPPTNQEQFLASVSPSNDDISRVFEDYEMADIIQDAIDDPADGSGILLKSILKTLGLTQKTHYVEEKLQREYLDLVTLDDDGEIIGDIKSHAETTRIVYPTPLLDTTNDSSFATPTEEWCYVPTYRDWWPENEEISIFYYLGVDFEATYNTELGDNLSNKLMDERNTEFKVLFDYIFPVKKYLSMLNVYTIMTSTTLEGVEESFFGTKDSIWQTILSLEQKGATMQSGPTNLKSKEIIDIFSDPRMKAKCCYTFDGIDVSLEDLRKGRGRWMGHLPENPFKGQGLDFIANAIKESALQVFKQITELVDPNIQMATKILDLWRALGLCPTPPLIAISIGLLPATIFGLPPVGIGNLRFALTPLGLIYWFLGYDDPCEEDLYSGKTPPNPDCTDCRAEPGSVFIATELSEVAAPPEEEVEVAHEIASWISVVLAPNGQPEIVDNSRHRTPIGFVTGNEAEVSQQFPQHPLAISFDGTGQGLQVYSLGPAQLQIGYKQSFKIELNLYMNEIEKPSQTIFQTFNIDGHLHSPGTYNSSGGFVHAQTSIWDYIKLSWRGDHGGNMDNCIQLTVISPGTIGRYATSSHEVHLYYYDKDGKFTGNDWHKLTIERTRQYEIYVYIDDHRLFRAERTPNGGNSGDYDGYDIGQEHLQVMQFRAACDPAGWRLGYEILRTDQAVEANSTDADGFRRGNGHLNGYIEDFIVTK